jgi:hypothetical protein
MIGNSAKERKSLRLKEYDYSQPDSEIVLSL